MAGALIPAATVESTLAGLNRDQGVADDAGGLLQRQMLLADLGAYIDDPQRFGERLDRYIHETTGTETHEPGRLPVEEFVRWVDVTDLEPGHRFRNGPDRTTWTFERRQDVSDAVYLHVTERPQPLLYDLPAVVQLMGRVA